MTLEVGVNIGVCNRLDRNTSGVIFSPKSLKLAQALNEKIKNHEVRKLYRTIVAGVIEKPIELKDYIKKDTSLNKVSLVAFSDTMIHTLIRPLRSNKGYTELEVEIMTGKTHQIRAHLQSIGHPIIGDIKYGNQKINRQMQEKFGLQHQLLHAYSYEFNKVGIDLPKDIYYKPFIAPLPDHYQLIMKAVF
jgi:23S rRNA pseudouridine955/2504/2580 synthase